MCIPLDLKYWLTEVHLKTYVYSIHDIIQSCISSSQTCDTGAETHFKVVVVSDNFEGMPLIKVLPLLPHVDTDNCAVYTTLQLLKSSEPVV